MLMCASQRPAPLRFGAAHVQWQPHPLQCGSQTARMKPTNTYYFYFLPKLASPALLNHTVQVKQLSAGRQQPFACVVLPWCPEPHDAPSAGGLWYLIQWKLKGQ